MRGELAHSGSSLWWESHDRLAGFTATAVVGAMAFAALAVFGLPTVDLHAPPHYAGVMDPLCGMTRAMRLLGQGEFASAWRYNPGSFPLAAAGGFFMLRGVAGVTTGKWLMVAMPRRALWTLLVLGTVILWINQQVHADLLMTIGVR